MCGGCHQPSDRGCTAACVAALGHLRRQATIERTKRFTGMRLPGRAHFGHNRNKRPHCVAGMTLRSGASRATDWKTDALPGQNQAFRLADVWSTGSKADGVGAGTACALTDWIAFQIPLMAALVVSAHVAHARAGWRCALRACNGNFIADPYVFGFALHVFQKLNQSQRFTSRHRRARLAAAVAHRHPQATCRCLRKF